MNESQLRGANNDGMDSQWQADPNYNWYEVRYKELKSEANKLNQTIKEQAERIESLVGENKNMVALFVEIDRYLGEVSRIRRGGRHHIFIKTILENKTEKKE